MRRAWQKATRPCCLHKVYSDESRVELTEQVAWWVDNQDVLQLEGDRVKGLAVGQAMVYATNEEFVIAQ